MANKNKIKQLIDKLGQFESSLPVSSEVKSIADDVLSQEFQRITKQIKDDTTVKYLEELNSKLASFKRDLDLSPFSEQLSNLESDINTLRDSVIKDLEDLYKVTDDKQNQLQKLITTTKDDLEILTNEEVANLLNRIVKLEKELSFQTEETSTTGNSLKGALNAFEKKLNTLTSEFSKSNTEISAAHTAYNTRIQDNTAGLQNALKEIKKLRTELLTKIANQNGGGNANRNIAVNGNGSVLSKYTDINLVASSNISLIPVANNTTKQTDIFIASSGGGAGTVTSVVSGTGIFVDNTNSATPIINLGASSVVAGSYGDATTVPQFTVDAQGRISQASNVGIAFPVTAPAGANTQVQFNDNGAFGASSTFTWNKNTSTLSVGLNGKFIAHAIQADATDGLNIFNSAGKDIADFGPANTANVTFFGPVNFSSTISVTSTLSGSGAVFSGDVQVMDEVYGAGWNGSLEVPTKNAVYDKIETIVGGSGITRVSSVITANTTGGTTTNTDYVYIANAGLTFTLPTAINNNNYYLVKNFALSSVLISTTEGQTIDDSPSALMASQYDALGFISNGSVWAVV